MLEVLTELQITEISPETLIKSLFITNVSQVLLKILGTLTGNICGGVSFQNTYKCVIEKLELLERNDVKDVSLGIFQNFQNSSFKEYPLQRL